MANAQDLLQLLNVLAVIYERIVTEIKKMKMKPGTVFEIINKGTEEYKTSKYFDVNAFVSSKSAHTHSSQWQC